MEGCPKRPHRWGQITQPGGWQGRWEIAFQEERAEGTNTRVQRAVLADRNSQGHQLLIEELGKQGHPLRES